MILIVMYWVMIIHDLTFPTSNLFIQWHIYITLNIFWSFRKGNEPYLQIILNLKHFHLQNKSFKSKEQDRC
jgi:hypothetical protein